MTDFTTPTITILQPLIKKPTLKPALLQKPPFRFLHDIITNLQSSPTPFPPTQLFDPSQLNSENVKEKEQKVDFLTKVINSVNQTTNLTIDVNPMKIIAGLEPEKTNILLQQLANAALKQKQIETAEKKETTNPTTPQTAERPNKSATEAETTQSTRINTANNKQRSSNTNAPSSSSISSSITLPPPPAEPEDYTQITQRLLGSLITKPVLKTPLLQKPPFRFIHDIVTSLIKSPANFPANYFTDEESDSAKVDSPEKKITFLTKLIEIISSTINADLSTVNPKKIIAGHEPEQTNLMLQNLAKAAATAAEKPQKKTDSISTTVSTSSTTAQPTAASATAIKVPVVTAITPPPVPSSVSSSASTAKTLPSPSLTTVPKLSLKQVDQDGENNATNVSAALSMGINMGDEGVKNLERPMTARQGPPKLKTNLIEKEEKKEEIINDTTTNTATTSTATSISASAATPIAAEINNTTNTASKAGNEKKAGLILEGEVMEEEEEEQEDESVLSESGSSLTSTSSQDKSNTIKQFEEEKVNVNEQGNLMRKILAANQDKSKSLDTTTNAPLPTNSLTVDTNKTILTENKAENAKNEELRLLIQQLCHSINPLGKCMEFIVDDMDEMSQEDSSWMKKRENYMIQLEEEKKITTRILEPLCIQLEVAELKLKEQERKVIQMKAHIWKNEQLIMQLMEQKMTGES